jgi:hypothetical protein
MGPFYEGWRYHVCAPACYVNKCCCYLSQLLVSKVLTCAAGSLNAEQSAQYLKAAAVYVCLPSAVFSTVGSLAGSRVTQYACTTQHQPQSAADRHANAMRDAFLLKRRPSVPHLVCHKKVWHGGVFLCGEAWLQVQAPINRRTSPVYGWPTGLQRPAQP